MDYKEKVIALLNSQELSKEQKEKLEDIFPELKESDDERIRKEIIATIHLYYGEPLENEAKEMIAWLEKHGEKGTNGNKGEFPIPEPPLTLKHAKEVMGIEQKPAWSEEDERMLKKVIDFIPQCMTAHGYNEYINWFKSLKERVQPKQEWSEEDEERLSDAIFFVREYQIPTRDKRLLNAAKETEDWLRTLRPQNTWKPSDEQMEALDDFIYAKYPNVEKYGAAIKLLYQDLKKLKEK